MACYNNVEVVSASDTDAQAGESATALSNDASDSTPYDDVIAEEAGE